MIVYPKLNIVCETPIMELSSWGGMPADDVKGIELPSKENMAAQCLKFYLSSYKRVLLQDGEHSEEFKVDSIVTEIAHIYSLLKEPWVNNHKHSIQLMATVSTII